MAGYRKLGRTSSQRKAMIRSQVTALLYHGSIKTTEARAKEIRKVAEGLIAMAVKEKDNFETVTVTAKVARKDKDGKRVKEVVNGKKVTVYDEVQKEIKKDNPSRPVSYTHQMCIRDSKENLPKVLGGLGIAILSTNQGVITDKEARRLGVGGEVLAFVW